MLNPLTAQDQIVRGNDIINSQYHQLQFANLLQEFYCKEIYKTEFTPLVWGEVGCVLSYMPLLTVHAYAANLMEFYV